MGRGIVVDKQAALALTLALLAGCTKAFDPHPGTGGPKALQAAELPTSRRLATRRLEPMPGLREGADVGTFLRWLGGARVNEREKAKRSVAEAGKNPEVVATLIQEAERAQRIDYTRALLTLAVLGETRSDAAIAYLENFVSRPLPETGTVVEGQIIERMHQEQLQAKAVDGLAYANTPASNAAIGRIIAAHPSRVVRAEAINAYLWNHGDTEGAKRDLSAIVRPGEAVFLQRVRKMPGERREAFNAKVKAFSQNVGAPPAPRWGTELPQTELPAPRFEDPPPPF